MDPSGAFPVPTITQATAIQAIRVELETAFACGRDIAASLTGDSDERAAGICLIKRIAQSLIGDTCARRKREWTATCGSVAPMACSETVTHSCIIPPQNSSKEIRLSKLLSSLCQLAAIVSTDFFASSLVT